MNEPSRSKTILVIDDEEIVRQSFHDQLEDLGYRVLAAEHGRAGVEVIEQEHPDLVLTDLRMPEMDGLEVIRQSKELAPDTPIIVISGAGRIGDALEALRLGAYDYLIKPVNGLQVLEHTIGKALEKAQLSRENRAYQEHLEELVGERTRELEQANMRLANINARLRKVVATTQGFSACIDVSSISTRILDEFANHMGASGGSLYFVEPDGLRRVHSLGPMHTPGFLPFPLAEQSIFKQLLESGEPLLIDDIACSDDIAPSGWDGYQDGSLLAFPLPGEAGGFLGLLTLHSKELPPFIEQDKEIGAILASYSCEAIRSIHATETVMESERRFRELADMLPQSICETDRTGTITYCNRKAFESFGYTVDELTADLKILDVIAPHDRERAAKNAIQVLRGGKEQSAGTEYTAVRKDGSNFPVLAYSAPILQGGEPIGMRTVVVDITHRKQQEERILHHAHFDSLTDLPNRFLALDRLVQLIREAQRAGSRVAVLFLDLDDFKKVNDTLGHDVGDQLLVQAAERLRNTVREKDTIGRLGGDEFILLLGGLTAEVDARPVAENLLDRFRDPFRLDDRELVLTASLGIAVFPDDGDTPTELLRKADTAMYHAKEQGRNAYRYFTAAMNQEVSRRLALEEQLHGALGRGEFHLCYQPVVDIPGRTVIGVEALLRWSNPVLGEVSPVEFIPITEQTGLIVPIGQFVLTEALAMTAQWQRACDWRFKIAVNLSPCQFRDPGLPQCVEAALQEAGISSESLELELTEGVLMSGHAYIDDILTALSDLGVSIAMDDFGTGYSSLGYLRSFPFDTLKIDRSFVNDITVDPADRELVNAAIAMAHGLGLKVVAEGVETVEQLAHLATQGCDLAQGHLFGKPVTAEEITAMLKRPGGAAGE